MRAVGDAGTDGDGTGGAEGGGGAGGGRKGGDAGGAPIAIRDESQLPELNLTGWSGGLQLGAVVSSDLETRRADAEPVRGDRRVISVNTTLLQFPCSNFRVEQLDDDPSVLLE